MPVKSKLQGQIVRLISSLYNNPYPLISQSVSVSLFLSPPPPSVCLSHRHASKHRAIVFVSVRTVNLVWSHLPQYQTTGQSHHAQPSYYWLVFLELTSRKENGKLPHRARIAEGNCLVFFCCCLLSFIVTGPQWKLSCLFLLLSFFFHCDWSPVSLPQCPTPFWGCSLVVQMHSLTFERCILYYQPFPVCACARARRVCVCVCVCERGRERERGRESLTVPFPSL